jgi:DNA-binding transcriptional LysR family regulator
MSTVNLKDLDLKLLVVFEAIYSAGNISRAAEKLAMSQPAVSNLLARLRELVGDPLFARGRRGVEPTMKAQAMIGPVREALGLIGRQFGQTDQIDLSTYRRTFRISVMDPIEPLLLPPLLNLIGERAPGVSIEGVLPRPEFSQDILNGTVDLVCFAYPISSPEISVVPICPVDLVMAARRHHPRIGKTLDAETMGSLGFVALSVELRSMTQVDRELLLHGIKRRVVMAVPRMWSMPALVAQTDLVATLPRAFAQYVAPHFDLAIHELPVPISEQHMYMMWHVKMDADPGHTWLRETLQATARERLMPADEKPPNVTPFVRRPKGRAVSSEQ